MGLGIPTGKKELQKKEQEKDSSVPETKNRYDNVTLWTLNNTEKKQKTENKRIGNQLIVGWIVNIPQYVYLQCQAKNTAAFHLHHQRHFKYSMQYEVLPGCLKDFIVALS